MAQAVSFRTEAHHQHLRRVSWPAGSTWEISFLLELSRIMILVISHARRPTRDGRAGQGQKAEAE